MRRVVGEILILVALLLASCQPDAPVSTEGQTVIGEVTATQETTTQEAVMQEETTEAEDAEDMVVDSLGRRVEKPQYGGWLNVATTVFGGFEPAGYANSTAMTYPVYEPLCIEDWKRGPSGTNEIPLASFYTPMEGHTGLVAESWEQTDLQTIIFYIRKGIHFQNKPPTNGREITADDVVYSFNRVQSHPRSEWNVPQDTPEEDRYVATALDKWTVQIKLPEPDVFIAVKIAGDFVIQPHEVVDEYGHFEDWRNACGSGPFMIEDVVVGSSVSYVRNPNYWMKDPFLPENSLPYIDGIKLKIMPDEATMLAAMRTGKIDRMWPAWEEIGRLLETNPEIQHKSLFPAGSLITYLRTDIPPFNDKRVRRALSLATNHEEIKDSYYEGQAEMLTWPIMPNAGDAYTPLEELPPECKELFGYDLDKAKELLAEAGYPNGFNLNVVVQPRQSTQDLLALLKSYWDQAGIMTEIEVMEAGAFDSLTMAHGFPMMAFGHWGNSVPLYAFTYAYRTGHAWNSSVVAEPYIDETWDTIKMTLDPVERNRMFKELNIYAIEQAYYTSMPRPYYHQVWQPWLKGFSGEYEVGRLYDTYGAYRYVWLDLDLKESITGTR